MAGVAFAAVAKRFGSVEAVRELTLEVADGEFMVLVGPSGSGKTTALRMLAGLESVSAGEIRIGERVVNRVPPRERDVAMVFQDYALYPQMRVYDNLAFALRRRKVPKPQIDERVRAAAASLGIEALLDRRPGQLSGGQAQRVALGRALVREPQVFLMDEPLSNLDATLRTQTRGEIRRLQQEIATTTVFVTHDQVEAMTMGDRIAVMNDGVLEQVGTPEEVYERPANRFVGGFIGSPAMQFVDSDRLGLDLPRGVVSVSGRRRRARGRARASSGRCAAASPTSRRSGARRSSASTPKARGWPCSSRAARRCSRGRPSSSASSPARCGTSTRRAAPPCLSRRGRCARRSRASSGRRELGADRAQRGAHHREPLLRQAAAVAVVEGGHGLLARAAGRAPRRGASPAPRGPASTSPAIAQPLVPSYASGHQPSSTLTAAARRSWRTSCRWCRWPRAAAAGR